jgi:RNA polymerase sigma-70 factor (ECF subfamily)
MSGPDNGREPRVALLPGADDKGVVHGAADNRSAWLARHVLPHEPGLRRYLLGQRLPSGLDVDDVIQEIYGVLVDHHDLGTIRDVRAFMWGVARNIVLMHLRRARIVSIHSLDEMTYFDPAADEPSPEDHVSDRQQLHLLALTVSGIREPWRSAFLLRATDDLSFKEIGRRLGMTENAVQKSHAKILLKLMQVLGRGGNRAVQATPKANEQQESRNERSERQRDD